MMVERFDYQWLLPGVLFGPTWLDGWKRARIPPWLHPDSAEELGRTLPPHRGHGRRHDTRIDHSLDAPNTEGKWSLMWSPWRSLISNSKAHLRGHLTIIKHGVCMIIGIFPSIDLVGLYFILCSNIYTLLVMKCRMGQRQCFMAMTIYFAWILQDLGMPWQWLTFTSWIAWGEKSQQYTNAHVSLQIEAEANPDSTPT